MEPVFREMVIQDYEEVITLWKTCEGIGLSAADSKENIARFLEQNPHQSFLSLCEDRLAGAVLCGNDSRRGYLYHLAVHPDFRKKGIGRSLVERCMSALAHFGIQKCHIFVYEENQDGIDFWRNIHWVLRTELVIMSRDVPDEQVLY